MGAGNQPAGRGAAAAPGGGPGRLRHRAAGGRPAPGGAAANGGIPAPGHGGGPPVLCPEDRLPAVGTAAAVAVRGAQRQLPALGGGVLDLRHGAESGADVVADRVRLSDAGLGGAPAPAHPPAQAGAVGAGGPVRGHPALSLHPGRPAGRPPGVPARPAHRPGGGAVPLGRLRRLPEVPPPEVVRRRRDSVFNRGTELRCGYRGLSVRAQRDALGRSPGRPGPVRRLLSGGLRAAAQGRDPVGAAALGGPCGVPCRECRGQRPILSKPLDKDTIFEMCT